MGADEHDEAGHYYAQPTGAVSNTYETAKEKYIEKSAEVQSGRIANTCQTASGRCTFLAGFAYYEMGRFGFSKGEDSAYIAMMTATYVMSLVAASFGAFILFYMRSLRVPRLKLVYCEKVEFWVGILYRIFCLALVCNCAAITRIGSNYYPDSKLEYLPLYMFAAGIVWLIINTVVIGQIHAATDKLKLFEQLDTSNPPQAAARLARGDVVADRSVFLAGFAFPGIARYLTRDPLDWQGTVYLILCCLSGTLAIVNAFVGTTHNVVIRTLKSNSLKALFCSRSVTRFIFRGIIASFFISLTTLLMGVAFVGWGTLFAHENHRKYPGIIVAACAGLFAVVSLYILVMYKKAVKLPHLGPGSVAWTGLLARVSSVGGQATISAGFVFYNIVTFRTDVENLDFADWNHSAVFLYINVGTFILGFVAAMIASFISLSGVDGPRQAFYAKKMRMPAGVCVICFVLSLLGFLAGYGSYGLAKFNPKSYIPLGYAIAGVVMIVVGWVIITVISSRVNRGRVPAPEEVDTGLPGRLGEQLDTLSGRALFFGGFAYFATNFFFTSDREEAHTYLAALGCSFMSSIVCVTFNTIIKWALNGFTRENETEMEILRAEFARRVGRMVTCAFILFLLALVSFLMAFSLIGRIKSIDDYEKYSWPMLIGGIVGFLATMYWIAVVRIEASWVSKHDHWALPHTLPDSKQDFPVQGVLDEVGTTASNASFVAGNVFFEIIFAEANGATWVNYTYFIFSTIAFVTGCVVIVIATMFSTEVSWFKKELMRQRFARRATDKWNLSQRVFKYNNIMQYAWLISVIVLGPTKYHCCKWWSVIFSGIGFVLMSVGWYFIRKIWVTQVTIQSEMFYEHLAEQQAREAALDAPGSPGSQAPFLRDGELVVQQQPYYDHGGKTEYFGTFGEGLTTPENTTPTTTPKMGVDNVDYHHSPRAAQYTLSGHQNLYDTSLTSDGWTPSYGHEEYAADQWIPPPSLHRPGNPFTHHPTWQ